MDFVMVRNVHKFNDLGMQLDGSGWLPNLTVRKFINTHTYQLKTDSDSNGELKVTNELGFLNSWVRKLHLGLCVNGRIILFIQPGDFTLEINGIIVGFLEGKHNASQWVVMTLSSYPNVDGPFAKSLFTWQFPLRFGNHSLSSPLPSLYSLVHSPLLCLSFVHQLHFLSNASQKHLFFSVIHTP